MAYSALNPAAFFLRSLSGLGIAITGCFGDPNHDFARIYRDGSGHDYLLAFSCKMSHFCPRCKQKRVLLYGKCEEKVLGPVACRRYVFTVPRLLWPIVAQRREWLGELCWIAVRRLAHAYAPGVARG